MECYNLFGENYRASNDEINSEPPNIYLDDNIIDIKFCPTMNVIAVSTITGEVKLYSFTDSTMDNILSFYYHKENCRCLEFSDDGNFLFTGSADKSIGIITNGELLYNVKKAHDSQVNVIKYIDNNAVIASGDDDGIIKMWDFRICSTKTEKLCVARFSENDDTITG